MRAIQGDVATGVGTPVGLPPPSTSPTSVATSGSVTSPRQLARDLLTMVRPAQWLKNVLVVPLALVQAPRWTADRLGSVAAAVVAFTLAASLTYVLNDLADRDRDRTHATKRHRPLAAGRIPPWLAWAYAVALAGALLGLLASGAVGNGLPLLGYVALTFAYSAWLKHIPLVELLVVTAGFGLRFVQGAVSADVAVPVWLLVCVCGLCLLMIMGKRRHELGVCGSRHRPALSGYSQHYLDHMIVLAAGLTVLAYLQYLQTDAVLPATGRTVLLLAMPFGLSGLLRYLQILFVEQGGADPVRTLVGDRLIVITSLLWMVTQAVVFLVAHQPHLVRLPTPWAF